MNWLQCNYDLFLESKTSTSGDLQSFQKNVLIMKPEYDVAIEPRVRIEVEEDFLLSDFGWYWLTENEFPVIKLDVAFIDPFTQNRFQIPNLLSKIYLTKSVWDFGVPMLQSLPLEGQVSSELVDGRATFSGIKYAGKLNVPSLQVSLVISIVASGKEGDGLPKGILKALISNPIWLTNAPLRSTSLKKQILEELIVNENENAISLDSPTYFPSPATSTRGRSSSLRKSIDQKGVTKQLLTLNKSIQSPKLPLKSKLVVPPGKTRKISNLAIFKKP